MTVHSRSAWGARAPKSVSRNIAPVGVALHWVGTKMGRFSHSECAKRVRGIQSYHQNNNGWADIAYSAIVCPHGDVYVCRGKGVRTAANGTDAANKGYYAICYLGGEGDGFTDAGRQGFRDAMEWLGFGPKVTKTHRQVRGGGTTCPGTDITAWVNAGCPVKAPASPAPAPKPVPAPPTPVKAPEPVEAPTRKARRMLVRFPKHQDCPNHVFEVVGSSLVHINAKAWKARGLTSADVTLLENDHPLDLLNKVE